MLEKWASVEGYKGLYEVSSFGRIRSLDRVVGHRHGSAMMRGRILSTCVNKAGYEFVSLSKDCSGKSFTVHRLVAKAFLLPESEKAEVNHKDFNKSNNRVENLEWATRSYNHTHAMNAGRFNAMDNPSCVRKLTPTMVKEIFQNRSDGESCSAIAAKYGVDRTYIYKVLKKKILSSVI
jgi:hypothetical protein